jgi:hypothetical protein
MSRKLINTRNETIKIGEYTANLLLDKNDKIYVRVKDLKDDFHISQMGFRQWVKKIKSQRLESCFTEENSVAVEILDGEEVANYVDNTDVPKYFIICFVALRGILKEEKKINEAKNEAEAD